MYFIRMVIVFIALLATGKAYTQPGKGIPPERRVIHEQTDKTLQGILKTLPPDLANNSPKNKELNSRFTKSVINKVDSIQNNIETDSSIDGDKKIKLLRGLNDVLDAFEYDLKAKELTLAQLPGLIDAYDSAVDLVGKDLSILPVIQHNDVVIGRIIIKGLPFENNKSIYESKEFLVLRECQKSVDNILPVLFEYPDVSFADSLIRISARSRPEELYIFAQAKNTPLGAKIHHCEDPVVKIIASLADIDEGRLYFPFLGNLVAGRITMADIQKTFGESYKVNYYKLLVATQIDYAERQERNDTPIALNSLMDMLKRKALSDFIDTVNELHDQQDIIRLKTLEKLNAQDLYYLCIAGENDLYTTSYLKIYNKIFRDEKIADGYALLQNVHFDYFKRFIKMASNFNTLDDFLNRMNKGNADSLMRSFVNGMEGAKGLEDAVDVADSYASIARIRLRSLILGEVQKNLARFIQDRNKTAAIIYGLLDTIFLSMNSAKNIDISSSLRIPPVYQLYNSSLRDHAGKIIIQQFFYGDKDGKFEFNNFLKAYHNSNWKITWKDEWVEVHSVKGTDVVIYSNKPLDEETFLDIKTQESLGKYLEANKFHPSIVIHRGHSYYVGSTIRQMASSAKLVVLGSCGGYGNLSQVIKTCPYVHIIATKQQGSGRINQPMIAYLTELLRQGKNLNWPVIWKVLEKKFKDDERFKDYIPPHQNLGAIFIMAYNTAIGNVN